MTALVSAAKAPRYARLEIDNKKGAKAPFLLLPCCCLETDQPFEARRARRLLRVPSVPVLVEAEEPLPPVVALAPVPVELEEPMEEPLPVEAPLPIDEPLVDAPLPIDDEEPLFMPGAVEAPAFPGDGSDAPI